MQESELSQYNKKRVKLNAWVTGHHRAKLKTTAEVLGVTPNVLLMMLIDETYFDPISPPTLRRTVEGAVEKTLGFFRKHNPAWQGDNRSVGQQNADYLTRKTGV